MDTGVQGAGASRPAPEMLLALAGTCRPLLSDQDAFDARFLAVLTGMLPAGHPLRETPDIAVQMLYVVLRAVVSGRAPEITEAECVAWGERLAASGMPEDSYGLVGFAASRTARDASGDRWTSETGSQWSAVHLWVVEHFLDGARRAGVPLVAPPPVGPAVTGPAPPQPAEGTPPAPRQGVPSSDVPASDVPAPPDAERRRAAGPPTGSVAATATPDRAADVWGASGAISSWALDRTSRRRPRDGGPRS